MCFTHPRVDACVCLWMRVLWSGKNLPGARTPFGIPLTGVTGGTVAYPI
jgi:hypothetical protein